MDEEKILRQQIAAAPDDDTLRLAFADWLDEHDQPARAEFIRVQISLENKRDEITGRPWTDSLEKDYKKRAERLYKENEASFRNELQTVGEYTFDEVVFKRGFPEEFWLHTPEKDLPILASIADTTPVRAIRIFDEEITDEQMQYISAFPNLKRLHLHDDNHITDASMPAIAKLDKLEFLGLAPQNDVTHVGYRTLAESPTLSSKLEIDQYDDTTYTLGDLRKSLGIEPQHVFSDPNKKNDASWANRTNDRMPRTLT